jgi:hypothetical protein
LSGWPSVTDSEVNRNSVSESFSVLMGRRRVAVESPVASLQSPGLGSNSWRLAIGV